MRASRLGAVWAVGWAMLASIAIEASADALDPLAECGEDCLAVKGLLSPSDADELARLPAEVRTTVAEIVDRTMVSDVDAQALVMKLARGAFDADFGKVAAGRHGCIVYWYGFLDEGSRMVGRHQCRTAVKDGRLTVTKVTGDGFAATLYPYAGAVGAFVGRSYLDDHKQRTYDRDTPANAENGNFGNKVGVALADGGRLYLVSINENGFTEPDETFFEIIAVE